MKSRTPLVALAAVLAAGCIATCNSSSSDTTVPSVSGSGGQDPGDDGSTGGSGATAGTGGSAGKGGVGGASGVGGMAGKGGAAGMGDAGGTAGLGGGGDGGGDGGECFGAEACNPTGNPIGGGKGYSRITTPLNTNIAYNVATVTELLSALSKPPGVIYIPETANVDMSGRFDVEIPDGFTLASNRGEGGSLGGRIFQTRLPTDPTDHPVMFWAADRVRITGIRIEGSETGSESLSGGMHKNAIGSYNHKGLEIDNCEIYGWSNSGIYVGVNVPSDLTSLGLSSPELGSEIANIHHNYIHHCQTDGLGYGVMLGSAVALIKANVFDYTRHAITGSGTEGEGYEASYNVHLGNTTNNVFDVHPDPATKLIPNHMSGDTFRIHHNTFGTSQPDAGHVESYDVIIRGVPVHGAWIDHNVMQWFGPTHLPPVAQTDQSKGNVFMSRNIIAGVLYPDPEIDYH
jgi:hypothetical protein